MSSFKQTSIIDGFWLKNIHHFKSNFRLVTHWPQFAVWHATYWPNPFELFAAFVAESLFHISICSILEWPVPKVQNVNSDANNTRITKMFKTSLVWIDSAAIQPLTCGGCLISKRVENKGRNTELRMIFPVWLLFSLCWMRQCMHSSFFHIKMSCKLSERVQWSCEPFGKSEKISFRISFSRLIENWNDRMSQRILNFSVSDWYEQMNRQKCLVSS